MSTTQKKASKNLKHSCGLTKLYRSKELCLQLQWDIPFFDRVCIPSLLVPLLCCCLILFFSLLETYGVGYRISSSLTSSRSCDPSKDCSLEFPHFLQLLHCQKELAEFQELSTGCFCHQCCLKLIEHQNQCYLRMLQTNISQYPNIKKDFGTNYGTDNVKQQIQL